MLSHRSLRVTSAGTSPRSSDSFIAADTHWSRVKRLLPVMGQRHPRRPAVRAGPLAPDMCRLPCRAGQGPANDLELEPGPGMAARHPLYVARGAPLIRFWQQRAWRRAVWGLPADSSVSGTPAAPMMERVAYVSVPPAVEPFYTLARRNQSTVLFRGRVD